MEFLEAKRRESKLRLGLVGPSGSGKTYSALTLARGLGIPMDKVAVIDTENGSASLYADQFKGFKVLNLKQQDPETLVKAIGIAEKAKFEMIIIDSATHAWDYLLKVHSDMPGNSYTNWNKITPRYKEIVKAILNCQSHLILTLRAKTEYAMEKDIAGKTTVKKVGMGAEMRKGFEYELTTVFDINLDHKFSASKDRTSLFTGDWVPLTVETGKKLRDWLDSAEEPQIVIAEPKGLSEYASKILDTIKNSGESDLAELTKKLNASKAKLTDLEYLVLKTELDSKIELVDSEF